MGPSEVSLIILIAVFHFRASLPHFPSSVSVKAIGTGYRGTDEEEGLPDNAGQGQKVINQSLRLIRRYTYK